jgi:hypothetical protein
MRLTRPLLSPQRREVDGHWFAAETSDALSTHNVDGHLSVPLDCPRGGSGPYRVPARGRNRGHHVFPSRDGSRYFACHDLLSDCSHPSCRRRLFDGEGLMSHDFSERLAEFPSDLATPTDPLTVLWGACEHLGCKNLLECAWILVLRQSSLSG